MNLQIYLGEEYFVSHEHQISLNDCCKINLLEIEMDRVVKMSFLTDWINYVSFQYQNEVSIGFKGKGVKCLDDNVTIFDDL